MEDNEFIFLDERLLKPYYKEPFQLTQTERRYRNVNCGNCGERGHMIRDCINPITSFGIIAFKIINNAKEEQKDYDNLNLFLSKPGSNYPKIKFLMIQRKDTMGYIDFIRGKYPDNDDDIKYKLLKTYVREMTTNEKSRLITKSFDELWKDLWVNHDSKCFKNEYDRAKYKFSNLNVSQLVGSLDSEFTFAEFGFPKGRKNMKESNIECAKREFTEETCYKQNSYDIIQNYPPIEENFIGTNGIAYKHIYYLAKMKNDISPPKIDPTNLVQTGEVQNIGWFTYEECKHLIRPYDTAKKDALQHVYDDLLSMFF
jgi:ADP-ribose pyrophosphatase YjhB (NUDIX family)